MCNRKKMTGRNVNPGLTEPNLFPLSFGNRMVFKFRKRRPNMRKGMLGRISKTGIDSREKAPPRRLETCDRQIRFGE